MILALVDYEIELGLRMADQDAGHYSMAVAALLAEFAPAFEEISAGGLAELYIFH